MKEIKEKKGNASWIEETAFWREVTVGTFSTIISTFIIYVISTNVPVIFNHIKKAALEIQTASQDPVIVASLAEDYLKQGKPEKALMVSNDIVQVGYVDNSYNKVWDIRRQAEAKLNTVVVGQDKTMVKA